jgi:hypothetical protein
MKFICTQERREREREERSRHGSKIIEQFVAAIVWLGLLAILFKASIT